MLEINHVSKILGDQEVLKDISFSVSPGEIYGLIGYNGVGKTTLLKICSGIYKSSRGEVLIDGTPVYESASEKGKCFFMTEEAPFFDQTSLNQMRTFYKGMIPAWNDNTFRKLVEWFELDPDKKVSQFSKGMQRQASLCIAFSASAGYLFLDEAFDGLDYTIRREISAMLSLYAKERRAAVIISSHNLRELEDLADTIGMLNNGRLIYNGSAQQIHTDYTVCICRFPEGTVIPENLPAALCESQPDGTVFFMLQKNEEETGRLFRAAGAQILRIRPASLEEYFRIERKEKKENWNEIFA